MDLDGYLKGVCHTARDDDEPHTAAHGDLCWASNRHQAEVQQAFQDHPRETPTECGRLEGHAKLTTNVVAKDFLTVVLVGTIRGHQQRQPSLELVLLWSYHVSSWFTIRTSSLARPAQTHLHVLH